MQETNAKQTTDARTILAKDTGSALNKPRPMVVAVIGIPGSGKHLVAQALAEQLNLRQVNRDAIRDGMFPQCAYSFAEKRAAFRALLLALEINCLLGESSVIDGMTFARRRDLERVDKAIASYGFLAVPLFLDCSVETARRRLAEQVAANPALARELSPDIAATVRARFDTPPPNALVINADLPIEEVARVAVAAVAQVRAL